MPTYDEIRRSIQATTETLETEAAKNPDRVAALEQLRLAAFCRNIDREIGTSLWQDQVSSENRPN